jgi:hypothetical protein
MDALTAGLPELYSKFDDSAIEVLRKDPDLSEVISNVESLPQYWKEKLENKVKLHLPFESPTDNGTQYWRQLYNDYNNNSALELFYTGRYEYVWIGSQLYSLDVLSTNLRKTAERAILTKDIPSFRIVFDMIKTLDWQYETILIVTLFTRALDDDKTYYALLDLYKPYLTNYSAQLIIKGAIAKPRLVQRTLEVCSNVITEQEASNILFANIYDLKSKKLSCIERGNVMEYMLSLPRDTKYKLSDIKQHIFLGYNEDKYALCYNEVVALLAHPDKVMYDQVNVDTPQSALLFYESDLVSEEIKEKALMDIMSDNELFERVLLQQKVNITFELVRQAIINDYKSLELLIYLSDFDEDMLIDALRLTIEWKRKEQLSFLYNLIPTAKTEVERFIVTRSSYILPMLPTCVELGISIKVVGEAVAFNDGNSSDLLVSLGYSLDPILDDLVIHYLKYNNEAALTTLEKYIDIDYKYLYKTWAKSKVSKGTYYNKAMNSLMFALRDKEYKTALRLSNSPDLNPYVSNYESWWLDNITPELLREPSIKKLVKQLKHNKERQMMRGLFLKTDDLRTWIRLATGLKYLVTHTVNGNIHTYSYNGITVNLKKPRLTSKYHYLDLFSSEGLPLTSREDIKRRRLELLPH